jgi:hypothetical protein
MSQQVKKVKRVASFENVSEEMEDEQERRDSRVKLATLIANEHNDIMMKIEEVLLRTVWDRTANTADPNVKFHPDTLSVEIHGKRYHVELVYHKDKD